MALLTSLDALREYLRAMACSRLPLNNKLAPLADCSRSSDSAGVEVA
jgi:hypothetical protein